ncbi:HNH endonuclease [Ulvibacterium marinum]|uniref:HNH nuclease domain-containing protein n=1 Tax=Ulvibacterium marinum TaxID=2419782 RepID=A0A3B0C7X7_9FLAO|nr:HNH endonuclease [Ulvibacterium marinum]RKN79777.1 hypothetical protein D7Z94_15975 [Ulvibacterium marinum]
MKARQYKSKDVKKLFALSGNQCAEPSCTREMISEDGNNVLGEIAHIAAASSEGPRYNPNMTDDDRRSFANLILLCDAHHKMIDNPETVDKFPASKILEWKSKHEAGHKSTPQLDSGIEKLILEHLKKMGTSTKIVQNAEKIYNIDKIDNANFD